MSLCLFFDHAYSQAETSHALCMIQASRSYIVRWGNFWTNLKGSVYFVVNNIIAFRSILPQLHNPMSHEYYILFYSAVFTNSIVNPGSHKFESKPPKQNEPKPRREWNPKLVQCFSYTALYPLSYREVVAILHKTVLKNPRCHLWQNRSKSDFAVYGKIETLPI